MKPNTALPRLILLLCFLFCISGLKSQTVFVSSKGKKYHAEGCGALGTDKRDLSLEEARKQGYKAHKKCKSMQIKAIERKEDENRDKKG
ncbi:MAG TPA: hypothetical protein PLQ93_06770 [Bacteroidia bacterium]|nr:hypothetical protein [Bacteroidia bacterium]